MEQIGGSGGMLTSSEQGVLFASRLPKLQGERGETSQFFALQESSHCILNKQWFASKHRNARGTGGPCMLWGAIKEK